MKRRRNVFKSSLAILLTIATVLNTGFSTVASEIVTDDGIVVNTDAVEEVDNNDDATVDVVEESNDIDIEVVSENDVDASEEVLEEETEDIQPMSEDVEEADSDESDEAIDEDVTVDIEEEAEEVVEEEVYEEAEELKNGELTVDSDGIKGSGYDEISVYVNTEKLDNRDTFRIDFNGPASASYNPIIGDELDKTNSGYFDFADLNGEQFSIRANASDDVILSYSFNEDGFPMITVESKEAEKILGTTSLNAEDGEPTVAVTGSGYDTINVWFETEELTENGQFKLYVDTNADATVDGNSVNGGVENLNKDTNIVTVENLEEEEFKIYAVSDNELKIKTDVEIVDEENGEVKIIVSTLNEKRIYEYEDDKVYVRAVLEDPEAIPDDAVFSVSPVTYDTEKYIDAMNDAADEDAKYTGENTLFYDIAFYTDDSKSEEIEPEEGKVNITIEFKANQLEKELGVSESDEVEIAHITEDGSNINAEILDADISADEGIVIFDTDSFSIYAVAKNASTQMITFEFDDEVPDMSGYYVGLSDREWKGYHALYSMDKSESNVTYEKNSIKIELNKIYNQNNQVTSIADLEQYNVMLYSKNGESIDVTANISDSNYANNNKISVTDLAKGIAKGYIFDDSKLLNDYVVIANKVRPASTNLTYKEILNEARYYGIVANKFNNSGSEVESNFATGILTGGTSNKLGRGGYPGDVYIGEYTGSGFWIENNGTEGDEAGKAGNFTIYTTEDAKAKFSKEIYGGNRQNYLTVDTTSYSAEEIKSYVKGLISGVTDLSAETNRLSFSSIADKNGVIDLTDFDDGTYYIDVEDDKAYVIGSADGLQIRLKADSNGNITQNIIFTLNGTDVTITKYKYAVGDNDFQSIDPTVSCDDFSRHIIYYCPNATKVTANVNATGIFICPNAHLHGGIAGGWVVSDEFTNDGGEWHFIWKDMPENRKNSNGKTYDFNLTKEVLGDFTPGDTFTFRLQPYYFGDDANDKNASPKPIPNAPMPEGAVWDNQSEGRWHKDITITTEAGKTSYAASFGSLSFDAEELFELNGEQYWGKIIEDENGNHRYGCYMYKVTEIDKNNPDDIDYETRNWYIKIWLNSRKSVVNSGSGTVTRFIMDEVEAKTATTVAEYECKEESKNPVIFVNTYKVKKGNLEIRKSFGFPASMTAADKAAAKAAISFKIDGPEGYTGKTVNLNSFTETPANSGIYVYSESNVPLGAYTVTENNTYTSARYTCSTTYSVGENGTDVIGTSASVNVAANTTGVVAFTNEYSEQFGSLKIKKSLFGLQTNKTLTEDERKQITFTVIGDNVSKSITYNDIYVGNKGVAGEYVIEDLVIGSEYVVTETNALFGKGYTCSTSYRIDGATSTAGNSATITATSGAKTVEFVNTYSYSATGYLRINALKSMTGDAVLSDYNGEFKFEFTSEDDDKLASRGLSNSVVSNHTGGARVTFDTLTYTMADLHYDEDAGKNVGQYTYYMHEVIPADADKLENIVYDETVYKFIVDLEDLGTGVIKVTANVYKNDDTNPSYTYENSKISESADSAPNASFASDQPDSARPVFTNTYVKPNQIVFKASKSVTGATNCDKTFNFILEETSNVSGQVKKLENAVRVSAMDTQTVQFAEISFDKNDIGKTYTFHVYEEKEKDSSNNVLNKKDGITYSNAEYTVTVTVGETNNNVDLTNVVITPSNAGEGEAATNTDNVIVCGFVNDYEVNPVSMPIYGRKNLIGASSDDSLAGYSFTLTAVNANAQDASKCVLPANTVTVSEDNKSTGYFNFGNIEFKEAGEYQFKITEDHDGASLINGVYVLNNIVYSAEEYYVTVNVTANVAGDLVIADNNISIKAGSGDDAQPVAVAGLRTNSATSNVVFNNQKSTDKEVILLAKKSMSGLTLSDVAEEFEFELVTASADTPVTYTRQINNPDAKSNDGNGKVEFEPITYRLSDLASENPRTFTYYIHEIPDDDKTYYGYDEEYHRVDVVVTYDSTTNTISAVPTYVEGTYSAVIENTYSEDGYIDIEGNKTLVGRRITSSDDFAFALKYTGTDASGAVVKYASASNATFDTATEISVDDVLEASFKQDTFQWSKGKGTGTFKFDRIFVDKPGKYYFELTEIDGEDEEINYNVGDKSYLVTITATKDPSVPGKLQLSAEYNYGTTSDKKLDTIPSFINEIKVDGKQNIYAIKTISNGSAPDNIFKFALSRDPEGVDVVDEPVTNDGSAVTFSSETYTPSVLEGIDADENGVVSRTYTYYITEQVVSSLDDYYDFSSKVYAVKITVSTDAAGNFTVGDPVYYSRTTVDGEEVLTQISQSEVVFDNEYIAEGHVDLFMEKVLNGRDINGDEFSFTITEENAKTEGTPYSETVYSETTENGNVCRVNFARIDYDADDLSEAKSYPQADGTFARYYVVRENTADMADGVTPDSILEWHVVVTLSDDGEGGIDTDWYAYQGAFAPETSILTSIADTIRGWINVPTSDQHIRFTNTYNASGKVRFTASKKVVFADTDNLYPIESATDYSFVLREKFGDTEQVIPATNTLNEDGTISVVFGENGVIEFTDSDKGLHEYVLYETKVGTPIYDETSEEENKPIIGYNNNGIYYDMTEYHIYVNVADENNNGQLTVSTTTGSETDNNLAGTIDEDGVLNIADASFINRYRVTDDSIVLGGNKSFIGDDMRRFTFNLVETDADGNAIEGGVSLSTDNQGEAATPGTAFSFDPINYTYSYDGKVNGKEAVDGSYKFYYQISEVDESSEEGMEGVIFDGHTCNVEVTLTLTNGVLSHSVVYSDGDEARFENYYSDGTSVALAAKKMVTVNNGYKPEAITDPSFIFELTKVNDDSYEARYESAKNKYTATFADADSYELSDIDKEGNSYVPTTFTYQIRELSAKDSEEKAEYAKLFTATSDKTAEELVDEAYAPYDFNDDVYEVDVLVTPTVDATTNSVTLTSSISEIRKNGDTVQDENGDKAVNLSFVVFENEYSVEDGFVEIDGKKFVENYSATNNAPSADSFAFELLDANKELITSADPVSGVFKFSGDPESAGPVEELQFTYEDISDNPYVFYVREDIPETGNRNSYVKYDETLFKVEVYVADGEDGTLDIQKKIYIDGETNEASKPTGVVTDTWFTNEFFDGTQIDFDASKTISTEGVITPNVFEFTLTQISGNEIASIKDSSVWEKKSGRYVQTVTNNGGNVDFEPIEFKPDEVGEYEFEIRESEVSNKSNFKKHDENAYYVVHVDVEFDSSSNRIIANKTYKKYATDLSPASFIELPEDSNERSYVNFVNDYEDEIYVGFGGYKTLLGFDNDEKVYRGKYDFVLIQKNDDGTETELETVTIDTATHTGVRGLLERLIKQGHQMYFDFEFVNAVQHYTQDDIGETFTYIVKELPSGTEEKHIKYSRAVYTAEVTVGLDSTTNKLMLDTEYTVVNPDEAGYGSGQPTLDVDHTFVIDEKRREITFFGFDFTNKCQLDGEWQPVVNKEAKDFTLTEDNEFNFSIVETDSTFENAITGGYSDEKTNLVTGVVPFEKDSFDSEADLGKHYYVIRESLAGTTEENGKHVKKGIVYDDKEWHVTIDVIVSPEDSSKLIVGSEDYDQVNGLENQSSAKFTNRYEGKKDLELAVDKLLYGRTVNGDTFEFALSDSTGAAVVDKDGNDIVATLDGSATNVVVDGMNVSGLKYKFGTITYTQDSLKNSPFTYTVSEVKGDLNGMTYSEAVYTVRVTLKVNDEDGSLDYDLEYISNANATADNKEYKKALEAVGSANDMKFVNKYEAFGEWDPAGVKTYRGYTGAEIPDFTFILNEIDEDGKVLYGDSVHNNGESIAFSSATVKDTIKKSNKKFLMYSLDDVGTHYYEMYEDIPADAKLEKNRNAKGEPTLNGIIYDETVYKITVEVNDNGDGTLEVLVDGEDRAISEASKKFKFLNKYYADGLVNINVTKKMLGRELAEDTDFGKYNFTITDKATGESAVATNNILDSYGKPSEVLFKAEDISFLNYVVDSDKNRDDRGTHVYTITEGDSSVPGVEKDPSYFEVEILVTDAENAGELAASVKSITQYKNGIKYQNQISVEFINEYKAKGNVSFDGIKHVEDEAGNAVTTSLAGRYNFALYEFDDAARTGQGHFISSTECAADGSFTLNAPEFDQNILNNETSKERYFRIIEVMPPNGKWNEAHTQFESAGVVYDRSVYDVDVLVELDTASNILTVTKQKAVKKENVDATESTDINVNDKALFTNVLHDYEIIAGKKIWVDTVTNASSRPDVTVYLYSSATGDEVINTYTIKAPNDSYRFETDKNGNKLPSYDERGKAITYRVDEAEIDGYLKEVVGYNIYNTAGNIRIQKLDSVTRRPVEGATLAILSGTTELERWTSEVSAHVVKAALTAGTNYTLREISAPAGYEVASDMTFTVPTDGSDITVTMLDTPITGSVRLTKRDASTREALAGAEFSLYAEDGVRIYATGTAGSYRYTSTTSNGVFATDRTGNLTISDLPYGTYYFVETKAPDGYMLSDERASFSVTTNGQLAEITYLNTKATGSVRLRKINPTATRTLEGAVFELYIASPQTMGQAAASTIFSDAYYRYGTYRTNAAGEIYVDGLPWDDYYFIEVEAPTGYEIDEADGYQRVYTFRVDSTTTSTIDLGGIVNNVIPPTPPTPPTTPSPTPTPRVEEPRTTTTTTVTTTRTVAATRSTTPSGVLGARREKGGVVAGVLGVRAKPTKGVLGERVGPVTGDFSNIALWLILLVACMAMIITMLVKTGKNDKKAKAKK